MNTKAPETLPNESRWFLFHKDEILVKEEEEGLVTIPQAADLNIFSNQPTDVQSIGLFHEQECFIANMSEENIPAGFSFKKVKLATFYTYHKV